MAVAGVAGVAGSGSPASATVCATRGHAYVTVPATGRVIFSGYEGDQSVGVPTATYFAGQNYFRLGGNGIRPGTSIVFNVYKSDTFQFVKGVQSRAAGSNCVVNEESSSLFDLPVGNYQIHAGYTAGNTGQYVVTDVVTNLEVQPAPPPPPPPCVGPFCNFKLPSPLIEE